MPSVGTSGPPRCGVPAPLVDALTITSTGGFEIGIGPSVVVVDQGMAKQMTTMNLDSDIYAFIFTTRGLMAGLGLRGNRISRASR